MQLVDGIAPARPATARQRGAAGEAEQVTPSEVHTRTSSLDVEQGTWSRAAGLPARRIDRRRHDRRREDRVEQRLVEVVALEFVVQARALQLVAQGQSNKEIARVLDLAPSTVKTHLGHIMICLAAHNRTEAVVKARMLDLV